jgi:hypothetical protein
MLHLPTPNHYVPHIDNVSGAGVYFVRDTRFNELFPKDDLCKIGYSRDIQNRLEQFPNRDTLELFDFKRYTSKVDEETLLKVENEWMCSITYAFNPFKNKYTLDKNNFCCMSADMKSYFKYMLYRNHFRGINSNWGSTEWFVI